MNIDQMFPSKYIKSDDIGTAPITVTVKMVIIEEIAQGEHKPVMHFMGKDKGMVLNKTNATACAAVWGNETDQWQGKTANLLAQPVMFQGRQVMGLMLQPHIAQQAGPNAGTEHYQPGPHDQVPAPLTPDQQFQKPADFARPENTGGPGPAQDNLADDIPF